MKLTLNIARIIVGVLFIFSGLIKANDPLGLSYKMQEFFEIWGMDSLNHYTLFLSVVMNAFEIIAGFAVLLGWRMNLFAWLLLLLIIFFTFLTGYAHLSGKVRECGCFGNCIPLQAKQSFIKDLILLVLILFIFIFRKRIQPVFKNALSFLILLLVTCASFAAEWYTLTYLPVLDCLPYKVGNNIPEKMKPVGTKADKFDYKFVYEKAGQKKEFAMNELGQLDSTWKFIERKEVLVEKGDMKDPEVKDFSLKTISDVDSTEAILSYPSYSLLIYVKEMSRSSIKINASFHGLVSAAKEKGVPVYLVTPSVNEVEKYFNQDHHYELPVLKIDGVAFKTAARVNPTVFVLEAGTIRGKWSYARFDEARNFIRHINTSKP